MVSATGKILGGGGNGGNGGKGGNGEHFQRKQETRPYQDRYNQYGFGCLADDPHYGVYWDGSYKGIGFGTGLRNGNYGYSTDDGPSQGTCSRYAPGRGPISATSGGTGGLGGVGAGYNQTRTNGAPGLSGGTNAGGGGGGGNGGDWGVNGATGNTGGSGLFYKTDMTTSPRSGTAGTAGTSAGKAIVSTSAVQVYGINSPQARALNL